MVYEGVSGQAVNWHESSVAFSSCVAHAHRRILLDTSGMLSTFGTSRPPGNNLIYSIFFTTSSYGRLSHSMGCNPASRGEIFQFLLGCRSSALGLLGPHLLSI